MSEQKWRDWFLELAWEYRDKIKYGVGVVIRWVWPRGTAEPGEQGEARTPDVLILGPGGVGKTTLGRILSGQLNPNLLFDIPGEYDESLNIEHYALEGSPGVEMIVPPGQPHRRDATWDGLLTDLANGRFRGMILVVANGYHNHEIGTLTSYKDHPLYKATRSLKEFVKAFTANRREEELRVLRDLIPRIRPPASGKFWMLTLVTKQDLWCDDESEAEAFYNGAYAAEIEKVKAAHGAGLFRHEVAYCSLVISNFKTGQGEVVRPNTAGYDQEQQVRSFLTMVEKLDALRQWEAEK